MAMPNYIEIHRKNIDKLITNPDRRYVIALGENKNKLFLYILTFNI